MAEASAAPVDAPSSSGPEAGLDAAIAAMESSIPELQNRGASRPPAPAPDTAPAATQAPAAASPEQPAGDEPAPEPGSPDDLDEDQDPDKLPQPGQKLSRTGRLRQQLTSAEERARQLETHVQQRDAQYTEALRQFVDLVLPDATLEQLRVQAENGDWEAKQRVDTARAWRRMVAPIADMAHKASRQEFDQAIQDLRTLDGMDGDSHQKLINSATPGEKLRLMHQVAYRAATAEHKERISALEAEVQALKTNKAANGSQPANGGMPRNGQSGLAGVLGRDGLLTDEAMHWGPDEIKARFGVGSR